MRTRRECHQCPRNMRSYTPNTTWCPDRHSVGLPAGDRGQLRRSPSSGGEADVPQRPGVRRRHTGSQMCGLLEGGCCQKPVQPHVHMQRKWNRVMMWLPRCRRMAGRLTSSSHATTTQVGFEPTQSHELEIDRPPATAGFSLACACVLDVCCDEGRIGSGLTVVAALCRRCRGPRHAHQE